MIKSMSVAEIYICIFKSRKKAFLRRNQFAGSAWPTLNTAAAIFQIRYDKKNFIRQIHRYDLKQCKLLSENSSRFVELAM